MKILQALTKNSSIENFEAYIWRIAHNTYSSYVDRQNKRQLFTHKMSEENGNQDNGFEDGVLTKLLDTQELTRVRREMAFLAKIYREVMVMFYLEDMSISKIATALNVPVNRVKQRLFSARKKIRKEVSSVKANDLTLRPNYMELTGTGNFTDSDDVWTLTRRLLAQNILIACRQNAKSAVEVAKELDIPAIFIEDEMECLENIGILVNENSNKYLTDFIIVDSKTYSEIAVKHHDLAVKLTEAVANYVEEHKDRIMKINYLVKPESFSFILWSLIPGFADQYGFKVSSLVLEQLGIKESSAFSKNNRRKWTLLGRFFNPDEIAKMKAGDLPNSILTRLTSPLSIYGLDGGDIPQYDKYSNICLSNFYGARLSIRYNHPSDIYRNPLLLLAIRSIPGLPLSDLSEADKELAAKGLEKQLLKKVNNSLYPNMLVFNNASFAEFDQVQKDFISFLEPIAAEMANEYVSFIKEHLPLHLYDQVQFFVELTGTMRHWLIEECIKAGMLHVPDKENCGEGMWLVVEEIKK